MRYNSAFVNDSFAWKFFRKSFLMESKEITTGAIYSPNEGRLYSLPLLKAMEFNKLSSLLGSTEKIINMTTIRPDVDTQ